MNVSAVAAALAALAPANVVTGCRAITPADVDTLFPVEIEAIRRAVAKRRHEFATGRALLRELLGRNVPIAVDDNRRPDLPADVVGSLAHTGTLAVAAVAPAGMVGALGVDLEPVTPLDATMAAAILRPDEVDAHDDLDPHLAFTIKEAAYKAWSALGGRMLDHHDVRLHVRSDDERSGTFTAVIDDGVALDGRWSRAADHWLAFVATTAEVASQMTEPESDVVDGATAEAGALDDGAAFVPTGATVDIVAIGSGDASGASVADALPGASVHVDDSLAAAPDRIVDLAARRPQVRVVVVVHHPFAAFADDGATSARQLEDAWVSETGEIVDAGERVGPDRFLIVRAEDLAAGRTAGLVAFAEGRRDRVGAHATGEPVRAPVMPASHRPSRTARALAHELGYELDLPAADVDTPGVRSTPGSSSSGTDTIVPADRGAAVPASSAQQRLLFIDALEPGLSVHHLPSVRRLTGPIDITAIAAALRGVVARHEVLRTDFELIDGEWYQVVRPAGDVELPYDDLRATSEDQRDDVLAAAIADEVRRPFDLLHGLKARARLWRTAEDEHVLLVVVHHIASDGSSIVQMETDMSALYAAAVLGTEPALAPLPVQYADFTLWQRRLAESPAFAAELAYWKRTLSGPLPPLDLPADRRRPAVFAHEAHSVPIMFDAGLTSRWRAAARAAGVTPFMYLLATYTATLARWTDADDIVVGVANANRRAETENLIGLFASTLPIRLGVDVRAPFAVLLEEVKRQTLGALANQDVPFDEIVRVVNPPRDRSRAPIFQTLFVLNNMRPSELSGIGEASSEIVVEKLPTTAATNVEVDLAVTVEEGADGLFGRIDFASALYDPATIERFIGHWRRLLDAATVAPDEPISAFQIMSAHEQRLVSSDFASTGTAPSVPGISRLDELVALRVLTSPDATAFLHGREHMTYREWDQRANRLAHRLVHAGVPVGGRVGVSVVRSTSMAVAVLAVLKCGAAYVPLDADLPAERLASMIEDADVRVAVVSAGALDHVGEAAAALVTIDVDVDPDPDPDVDHGTGVPALTVDTSDRPGGGAAWVIFTSGSTGRPKGVEVTHESAINFVLGMLHRPGMTAADVVLAVPALSFDPSVLDLFVPALVGARVVIADREDIMDGARLGALIESTGATFMQATPTTWSMLLQSGWGGSPRLTALCGGEAMSADLAARLLACCGSVWNVYGPTETTVWATAHEVTEQSLRSTNVPVGTPIPNVVCRIVDADDRLVPVGVPGEILIGGPGVAIGYVGRPDLTAERFVPDPLDPAQRVYRTGDVGRWRNDGEIEHLGRRDHQIKLYGNRIELGEIEAALRDTVGVEEAVVVPLTDAGSTRLVAYVIASGQGGVPPASELRTTLMQRLPRPMIPSTFVALDELPLTPSGKIDRRALPAPTLAASSAAKGDGRPRDPLEARLAQLFATVLGRSEVGIHDDFFELGGFSLVAVRLFALIEAGTGRHLPLATLFEAPTVAALADHLRNLEAAAQSGGPHLGADPMPHIVTIRGEGERPDFFCVHGAGGNVLNFRDLSVVLGPSQPFFGLQARGTDGLERPHASIEEMADDYIAEIRAMRPHGPYVLGGYSGGGLVAYEMARRLVAAGDEVALVVLLDTYPPVIPPTTNGIRDRVIRLRNEGWKYLSHIVVRRIRARRDVDAMRRIDEIVAKGERVPVELRERYVDREFFTASKKYRPGPYNGRVLLIRGDTVPFAFRSLGDSYEWDHIVADPAKNLTVVVTPGGHETLLLRPQVVRVAKILAAAIDEIDAAGRSSLAPM